MLTRRDFMLGAVAAGALMYTPPPGVCQSIAAGHGGEL